MHPVLPASLHAWADTALSFIYPDVCQLCRAERATSREGYVGAGCRAEVRWIETPFCERCGLPFAGDITGEFEPELRSGKKGRLADGAVGIGVDA